jgi:hypothetical protein
MFEVMDVWFVEASTGCSCCSDENFVAGPFIRRSDAEACVAAYKRGRRLASQYAANGVYRIRDAEKGELLPDGRIIVGDSVYQPAEKGPEERQQGW